MTYLNDRKIISPQILKFLEMRRIKYILDFMKSAAIFILIFLFCPYIFSAEIECVTCSKQIHGTRRRDSLNPQLSGDGRYISFESKKRLTRSDENSSQDVYVYDRSDKKFELIHPGNSKKSNGEPYVSVDGKIVAFYSRPRSLLNPKHPKSDIYLYNRLTKENRLISIGLGDHSHNGEGLNPVLANGAEFVLFTSNATNLLPAQGFPIRQVYLFNVKTGVLELISKGGAADPANRPSYNAKISSDARYVAFKTSSTNLRGGLPLESLTPHIYLVDRTNGEMLRVDEDERGFDENNLVSGGYSLDDAGDVVFEARPRFAADAEVALKKKSFYLFQKQSGKMSPLDVGGDVVGGESPALSANGERMAFIVPNSSFPAKDGGVFVYEFNQATSTRLVAGVCRGPVISGNGNVIAFESNDPLIVGKLERGIWNIVTVQIGKF